MQHGAAVELLARTPLFHGVSGESLMAIMQGGELRRYDAGEFLAVAETAADAAIFVVEGEVRLTEADARPCHAKLQPGMFLNQMAMFIETSNLFNAVAEDEVMAFRLDAQSMGQVIYRQPHLAGLFAENIKRNLTTVAETLRGLDRDLEDSMNSLPEIEIEVEPAIAVNGNDAPNHSGEEEIALLELPDMNGPDLSELSAILGPPAGEDDFLSEETVQQKEDAPAMESVEGFWSKLQVTDLLAELRSASSRIDQTPPEPVHDQTASPSPAPRRLREVRRPHVSGQGLPIHDQAGARGSIVASPALGNSTT